MAENCHSGCLFITPATEILISYGMREFHNFNTKTCKKTRIESLQRHYKQLRNMDKEADAWKKKFRMN